MRCPRCGYPVQWLFNSCYCGCGYDSSKDGMPIRDNKGVKDDRIIKCDCGGLLGYGSGGYKETVCPRCGKKGMI